MDVAYILNQWQSWGVFDYVLPFLLIFAVVFGILASTNIVGKNKGVHVIIALVVGLMALQLDMVRVFFREVFPQLGVAIGVILALLILTGLFIHEKEARYWTWGIAAVAVIAWIIVITNAFGNVSWLGFGTYFSEDYIGLIVGAVLLIGVIIAVVAAKSEEKSLGGEFKRQVS